MNTKSRFAPTRRCLIFWTLFIGIGAVGGALCMLLDPTGKSMGMDAMLPYFQVLPFADILFRDFCFSGLALLAVNGVTNLSAAVLLIKKKKSGAVLGGIFGVVLMLWICIQFYIFPPNFMSTAYFVFGLCQALTGYAAFVFQHQESFCCELADYPNVGTNTRRLVVFFSRMGYVRKQAYEEANKTGACLYEIKSTEPTGGTAGFWWCGRFALQHMDMPIETPDIDLSSYDHVTICYPIWVFSLAAPMRSFCRQAFGKLREVDYICVHHTRGSYGNAAKEADRLLGIAHTRYRSVQCKMGRFGIVLDTQH